MNLSRIKNLVKQNGDKFIVLEEGEPELVIMSFGEYERITQYNPRTASSHIPISSRILDKVGTNTANVARKTEDTDAEFEPIGSYPETVVVGEPIGLPMRRGEIRLEDLPI